MNPEWAPIVGQVLEFLQKVLPGLSAAFIGGYIFGKSRFSSVQKELLSSEMKLKFKENEDAVEKELGGLSGSDALERAIKSRRSESGDQ